MLDHMVWSMAKTVLWWKG